MRRFSLLVFLVAACGTDVRSSQGGDPGVDAGSTTEGTTTVVVDAQPAPPDGIPQNLTPCEEAVYHSDFRFIQDNVFSVSCLSGCHTGTSPASGMDLGSGRAWASLVNVPSTQFDGWIRVVPRDPAASMLMVQIGGEPGPELEGYMPWGQPRLCDPLVDAMRRWIAAGAPES